MYLNMYIFKKNKLRLHITYIYIWYTLYEYKLGVDRLSAWPIIGADIKQFTDYRYRPFSKKYLPIIFFIIIIIFLFFFYYNANKHTIYRWHYLLVPK